METYKVVIFPFEGPEVEVVVRSFDMTEPCPCCNQKRPTNHIERCAAAQADGKALGRMLRVRGSSEFKVGLKIGLRD